ncbi:hypothetical protein KKB55_13630, partial [Myxococcota bacterium]|nr:hypothetical protein [Myxococcota bacterium]
MARPLDSPSEAPLEADALRPKHGWRATLARRKRRLAALAALGGFGLAALLAPPTPPSGFSADLKANLAAQLTTLLGQPVAVEGLRLNPIEAVGLGAALRLTFEVGEPRDLYTARARVSARGVPVAVSGLVNLTRSPKADDRLLWASADALIYATRGATPTPLSRAVVALDFTPPQAPREGPLIAFIAQRRYGHPRRPRRVDVLLGDAEAHEATLEGQRLRLVTSEGPVEVDLRTGATQPEGVRVVMGAGQERGLDLLADALRHAPLLGVEGVMGLERLLFDAQDQLSRWRHAAPFAPAPPPVQIHALSAPLAWPPQDLRREGDAPDEGVWGPLPGLGVEAPARRAFLRVDPRRPYQRVYLFAFDSRAVQLRFVGGARHPIGDTGARGSGRVPEAARPRLLAAFNGAFKATHGQFGAIEAGRVLVTPKRGAATVAMTIDGRAAFGVWDADTLRPPWVD